jgi:restriction system protein
MPIPKHNEIYREVLESIEDGAEHRISDIREFVAKAMNVTEEERNELLESGVRTVFDDRVGWSRTYLKKAGLLDYPYRGITQITENGKTALQEKCPIDDDYLLKFESFRNFRHTINKPIGGNSDTLGASHDYGTTPQEIIEDSVSQINSALCDELLTEIMKHESNFFEKLVVDLLLKMGYGGILEGHGIVTQASRDGGIDGIIREDKLGFSNIFIQAKRYALDTTVGRPEIQKFCGAATKGNKRLFITTAKFSNDAKSYANDVNIVLVDGAKLAELMIEYKLGVSVEQTFEIKKMDSDYFTDE